MEYDWSMQRGPLLRYRKFAEVFGKVGCERPRTYVDVFTAARFRVGGAFVFFETFIRLCFRRLDSKLAKMLRIH